MWEPIESVRVKDTYYSWLYDSKKSEAVLLKVSKEENSTEYGNLLIYTKHMDYINARIELNAFVWNMKRRQNFDDFTEDWNLLKDSKKIKFKDLVETINYEIGKRK